MLYELLLTVSNAPLVKNLQTFFHFAGCVALGWYHQYKGFSKCETAASWLDIAVQSVQSIQCTYSVSRGNRLDVDSLSCQTSPVSLWCWKVCFEDVLDSRGGLGESLYLDRTYRSSNLDRNVDTCHPDPSMFWSTPTLGIFTYLK